MKKSRPIESSTIGNWRNHLPRIKQQIQIHGDISDDLIDLGYETDKKWLNELKNVEAQDFPTIQKERFSKSELRARKRRGIIAAGKILIEKTGINADKMLYPLTWINGKLIQTKSSFKR